MLTLPDIKRNTIPQALTFLALLLVVPIMAFVVIQTEGPRIRQEALADLSAISQLKANQINAWLDERYGDAEMLMAGDQFISDVEDWLDHRDPVAKERLERRWLSLRNFYTQWDFLKVDERPAEPGRRLLLEATLSSGKPHVSDLYRDVQGQAWLDLMVPLKDPITGRKIGAVALRSQPKDFLFPVIQSWPTPSPSAETLLVRRDGEQVMFLNELRHRKETALVLRMPLNAPDLPAAIVVRNGKTQGIEGRDYRGKPVLAALRPIPGTPWFMVAKIDRDEVMRPLNKVVTWVSAVTMVSVLVMGVLLLRFKREQLNRLHLEFLAQAGERDRLLSLFYDLPFTGMAIIEPSTGHWVRVNERLCEILGYGHDELLSDTNWQQLTHADDLPVELAEYSKVLAGEKDGYQLGKRFVRKDGSPVDVALSANCVRRPDGSVEYFVQTIRDISERKQLEAAQDAQIQASSLLNAIAAVTRDLIFVKDKEGRYLFYNNEAARAINRLPQDVVGLDDSALYPPEQAARLMSLDQEILAGEDSMTFEEVLPTVDGERTFLTTKGVLKNNDGLVTGLYGISRDITDLELSNLALAKSNVRLDAIIESAMDAIITLDDAYRVQTFNGAAERMFGFKAEELFGTAIDRLMPANLHQAHQRHMQGFAEDGSTIRSMSSLGELRAIRSDGTEFPIEASISKVNLHGDMIFTVILRDVSQRRQAEDALRASEERFRSLVEQAADGIFVSDEHGYYTEANSAGCAMLGYTREDLLGMNIADVIDPAETPRIGPEVARLAGGVVAVSEWRFKRKDGTYFPGEVNGRQLADGRLQAILRDITERKATIAALLYQLDLLRGINEKATDSIFVSDAEGRITTLNPEAEAVFGYAADELLGQTLHNIIHHHHPDGTPYPMSECPLCRVYSGGETIRDHEDIFFRKDGSQVMVSCSNSAIEVDAQRLGAILVLHDITAMKQNERMLREQEGDLNRAQAVGHIGSWRLDIHRNTLSWSEENYRIFGVSEGTPMTYESFLFCVHPDDREYVDREWQSALHGKPYDIVHRLLVGGQVKWVREKAELEFDKEGNMLGGFGTTQDISELKVVELALEAARAAAIEEKSFLEVIMQTLPIGVAITDSRGGCIRSNAEYERIWGDPRPAADSVEDYTAYKAWWVDSNRRVEPHDWASALAVCSGELVVNQSLRIQRFNGTYAYVLNSAAPIRSDRGQIIGSAVVIQDITELKKIEQALRASEERFQLAAEIGRSGSWDWNPHTGEVVWSRGHFDILGYRAGEILPSYEAWANRIHPNDRAQVELEISRCMEMRTEYSDEFRVVWPDGSVHWLSARGRYEYDDSGICQRMLGVMADVTSSKQAELALREASERKDEFLAMLAHELRNPLVPIRNAAYVLGRLDVDEPRVQWAHELIEGQVAHLTHLVDDLLDVSRIANGKVSLKIERISLAVVLHQACETVQPLMASKGHRLDVRLPDFDVVLEGDRVRLVQVFQNLLNNAAKYTPDGGHIELEASLVGRVVDIHVRDNGMGMSKELLTGVFDLFRQGTRTLDRAQGGLGIGLTLVRRLVELHGGRVEVDSAGPGQGSIFNVQLPALFGMPRQDGFDEVAHPHADGKDKMRVLVIDDDPVVAESMKVFLEIIGHEVRCVSSGEDVMQLLLEFQPYVVLLDIGLPGMDGHAVARMIRQHAGGGKLKLVAVSGYGDDQAKERSHQSGFDRHLVKPVDPEVLDALLEEYAGGE